MIDKEAFISAIIAQLFICIVGFVILAVILSYYFGIMFTVKTLAISCIISYLISVTFLFLWLCIYEKIFAKENKYKKFWR